MINMINLVHWAQVLTVKSVTMFLSSPSQSEEDKQLQEELELMVERLSVSITSQWLHS